MISWDRFYEGVVLGAAVTSCAVGFRLIALWVLGQL